MEAAPGRRQVPEDQMRRRERFQGTHPEVRIEYRPGQAWRASWEHPVTADDPVALAVLVSRFASEYPEYVFRTQPSWSGRSLVAVRRAGISEPGLYAVITPSSDEMREALAQEP